MNNLPRLDIEVSRDRQHPVDLALVIPCFNEEEVLPHVAERLSQLLQELATRGLISSSSQVYFVDDGSADRTWQIILELAHANPAICGIKLSRNRGHQNALLCGLLTAKGDAIVSLDADLQDDLNVIPSMVAAFQSGDEIVYAVRRRRTTDSFFKRFSAEGYYRVLAAMGVHVTFNHADYRLMSRRAVETLRQYNETHLFLRALVPQLGFRSSIVEFDRAERFAGESKYPLRKMLALAWQGITSFTAYPLRLITGAGFFISIASLCFGAWALYIRIFTNSGLPGWASTVIPMFFLGGMQLLGIGAIGEYLAKVYEASKQRPRFHIEGVCGRRDAF